VAGGKAKCGDGPRHVLFVTWDGPQTDYLRGLFLPIFAGLKEHGYRFHVLQFTWADAARRQAEARACVARGISYRSHGVLRRPVGPGSLLTAVHGCGAVRRAVRELAIDMVMPRSTLPALSVMLAFRGRDRGAPRVVFDADGLPHDERVDFAGWSPRSLRYRLLRYLEARAVRRADRVITRSAAASRILLERAGAGTDAAKFRTVTNGRDPALFRPMAPEARRAGRAALGIGADAPVLVYTGSVGAQYCVDDMLAIFAQVRAAEPAARLLFLTGAPEDAHACVAATAPGLAEAMIVRRLEPADVPAHLALADVGLALRQPSFSMQAVFPVKIGEYLLCGLPVVATRGIGDIDRLVSGDAVCLVDRPGPPAVEAASAWILSTALPERAALAGEARALGLAEFGLEKAVRLYAEALSSLDRPARAAPAS
jgi:glycosyltransferase involved in cell wall biosynthesis